MLDDPSTSAQEAAVEAMAQAMYASTPLDQLIDSGVGARIAAARMLDALLSPTKKPCAECGGSGEHPISGECWTCGGDGFVASPAPIEGLLERADTVHVVDPGGSVRRFPTAEPLFRLPSKVRES